MGKRSGIRCKMCIFLHIGGVWPHMGCYAPHPGGPPDPTGGGGGGKQGGGGKLSYTICLYIQNAQNEIRNSRMHPNPEKKPLPPNWTPLPKLGGWGLKLNWTPSCTQSCPKRISFL